MNKWGIMVDLSHPSKAANMQALALSKAPVIASHSAARALADRQPQHGRRAARGAEEERRRDPDRGVRELREVAKPDSPERAAAIAALRKEFGLPAPGGGGPAAVAAVAADAAA